MNTVEEQSAAASETVHFATFDLSRGKWSGAQGKYSREHLWVYLSDSIQEIASEELQTMEMEFGQGLRIAANRGRQQLLPERWIALPSRAQLVTMPCGGALDFSRPERGDDADHTGRESQYLRGNARVRARRVPSQGQRLSTQLVRRLSGKDAGVCALSIGTISAIPNLTPPPLIFESHVDEKKWTFGRPASRRLIQFEPKLLAGRHHLKGLIPGKYAALLSDLPTEHLQTALVQCTDKVKRLSAGPFPGWQGSGRVRGIGSHAVIVCGKAPDLPSSLGVFFPKTK
jgi:hypothetical protein